MAVTDAPNQTYIVRAIPDTSPVAVVHHVHVNKIAAPVNRVHPVSRAIAAHTMNVHKTNQVRVQNHVRNIPVVVTITMHRPVRCTIRTTVRIPRVHA